MKNIIAHISFHILNNTISIVSRHRLIKRLDSIAVTVHGDNQKSFFHRQTQKLKRKSVPLDQRLLSGFLIPEPQCVWSAQVNLLWPGDDTTAGPVERLERITPVCIAIFNSSGLYIVRKHISPCKPLKAGKATESWMAVSLNF